MPSGGSVAASATSATAPAAASIANDHRQPRCWPTQVPTGTPTTAATETPPNSTASARPRTSAGNSPAAIGTTTDQNTACPNAVTTRVAMSVP